MSYFYGMILFVNTSLSEAGRTVLRQQLPNLIKAVYKHELPEADRRTAFQSANLLLGNPPADWFTPVPPNLHFWQLDSAGFDGYASVKVPCPVANMGDFFAWPSAETIVGGVLAFYRHIHELAQLQAKQQWVGTSIRYRLDLVRHKRVVILGAGAIGQAVRQMLAGFDCQIQLLARTDPSAQLHTVADLREALPQTDLVINCLPGSATGFFTATLIAAMKPGSVYANVGRGSTTDEPALIAALQSGHLAGAVLDVTEVEPLPTESLLWAMPNVILTQHSAGGQPNEEAGKVAQFLRNLTRFLNHEPLENQIELARGY